MEEADAPADGLTATTIPAPTTTPNVANSTNNVVMGGGGGGDDSFLECPICLQACVHPVELPCTHIFCFLCIKGVALQGASRCAICRAQIPHNVLTHPRLKDVSQLYKHTKSEYEWFYEARGGGWWKYDERSMQELDRAYDEGPTNCQLLIAGHVYEIDFSQMIQFRTANPNQSRRIKRETTSVSDKSCKGVAGIRTTQGRNGNPASTDATLGDSTVNPTNGHRRRRALASATVANNAPTGTGLSCIPDTAAHEVSDDGNHGTSSADEEEDNEGDEGLDSDDPDYLEDEEDEMELGEEEEALEETEPSSEGEEDHVIRDGARAPTRRSDRSNSSTTHTPLPSTGLGGGSGQDQVSGTNSGRNCSSASPSNGTSSSNSGGRPNVRSRLGSASANQSTPPLKRNGSGTDPSSSNSPSPQQLGELGVKTLTAVNSMRLSPAPGTQSQPQGVSTHVQQQSEESNPNLSLTSRSHGQSSITTTSGITCLLIGPGVRITVDQGTGTGQHATTNPEDEIL